MASGDRHRERVALDAVSDRQLLCGASCYVTLEPCAGTRKQPPCADTLLAAGIRRIVVGALVPHPKADRLGDVG